MNKELIIKYKIEFDHWLYGGKLQVKFVNDPWEEAPEDIFSYSTVNFVLVIDDEYVEFRRSLAEGKTIQHISATTGEWVDFNKRFEPTPSYTFLATPEYYRIKLEEPAFKVGDWVRVKTDTFEYDGTARISKGVKRLSKSDMWLFNENHYKCNPDNYIEHWQPKPDEWCWFWNEPSDIPILAKLISIEYFLERPTEYKVKTPSYISETVYSCMTYMYFKNCEPFIGQLPAILKD